MLPFSKHADYKYIPRWMYLVQAMLHIVDVLVSLVGSIFGFSCCSSVCWAFTMLKHSMDIRKVERSKV